MKYKLGLYPESRGTATQRITGEIYRMVAQTAIEAGHDGQTIFVKWSNGETSK